MEISKCWTGWYVKLLAGFKSLMYISIILVLRTKKRGSLSLKYSHSLSLRYSHTTEYCKIIDHFYAFNNFIYFNNQSFYYGYKNDRNIYWQSVLYIFVVVTRRWWHLGVETCSSSCMSCALYYEMWFVGLYVDYI